MIKRYYKRTTEDNVFDSIKIFLLIFILVITLYPFLHIIAMAFSSGTEVLKGEVFLLPKGFTLSNFKKIFEEKAIYIGTINSVLRTIVGVATGVTSNAIVAYVLSQKNFIFRKQVMALFLIPVYFGGGLVPTYFLMKALGLVGSFHVYWIPGLTAFYYIILLRIYFSKIPSSLLESARLDGANEVIIFIKIVLPLSVPILACIALFIGVGQWNSWIDVLIYNPNNPEFTTLQYELMRKLSSTSAAMNASKVAEAQSILQKTGTQLVTPATMRAAMTVVATIPILFIYPFLQKYFIHGLALGSTKE